jgi:hypothetical protein
MQSIVNGFLRFGCWLSVIANLFCNDPWFFFLHVLVADTREIDHFKQGIAEFVLLK